MVLGAIVHNVYSQTIIPAFLMIANILHCQGASCTLFFGLVPYDFWLGPAPRTQAHIELNVPTETVTSKLADRGLFHLFRNRMKSFDPAR